jgi:Family of unknown function (DUF5677)
MAPTASYRSLYRDLDSAINRAIFVSQKHAGIRSPTASHFYASALFTLMTTKSISLRKLLPVLKPKTMPDAHWDYGSVCTLTRSLLETRLAFYYLGYQSCSDDEWKCRWAIFCLHDEASRKKMLDGVLPPRLDTGEQAEYDEFMRQHRAELKVNPFFTSLPDGDQRRYLGGKKAYLYPLEEIAGQCGIPVEQFRFFYTFFSLHAHTLPVAYFRMMESNRGRGLHSELEEGWHRTCMAIAIALLNGAADEMELKFAVSSPSNV